jgi:hypothetical protein
MKKYFKNAMLNIRKIQLWMLVMSLLFAGCINQINYDVSSEVDRIVISGLISSNLEKQVIQVKRSVLTGAGNITNSTPVTNAQVKIINSNNDVILPHTSDGNYEASFAAFPGQEYTLEVVVGSEIYRSTPQRMPQPKPIINGKSILIDRQYVNSSGNLVNEKYVSLYLEGEVDPDFAALYRVYGQYEFQEFNPPSTMTKTCFVDDVIDNNTIKLISAKDLRTNNLTDLDILQVPLDARFVRMYAFRIFQYSLSEASLSYWKKIKQITNTGENLFDPPPGRITGNIKNVNNARDEVLGNFTLGAVTDRVVFTNMVQLGGVVTDVCQVRFNSPRPAICADCLRIPSSTTTRPSYWPL